MSVTNVEEYRPIFYPESIAILGASNNPAKFGGSFLKTTLSHGYKGKIYPVNPKGGIIQGLTGYTSVENIPYEVDFAVITIPSPAVPDAVEACVKKGIKCAQILSSGFKESGKEGKDAEERILRTAKKGGLKLIGPNCFGVYSPEVGLTLLPGGNFPTESGPVGFISQSGGGACDLVYSCCGLGIRFSIVISYGNACDIDATEMLNYFQADPKTKIVGAYIEGIRDGNAFFKALKSCAQTKPVIILKAGLSDQGYRGTIGHTGSMAGSKNAWEAAIKSAGAVPARDMRDLADCLMAFNCLDEFKGNRAALMAGGGLRVVEGLDAATEFGFEIPELDPAVTAKIQSFLPPAGGKGGNPTDLATPNLMPDLLFPIMDIMAEQEEIDFLLMYQILIYIFNMQKEIKELFGDQAPKLDFHQEIAAKAKEIQKNTGKPLALVLLNIASHPDHIDVEHGRLIARNHYTRQGIPCFDTGEQAFSVLKKVKDYYQARL